MYTPLRPNALQNLRKVFKYMYVNRTPVKDRILVLLKVIFKVEMPRSSEIDSGNFIPAERQGLLDKWEVSNKQAINNDPPTGHPCKCFDGVICVPDPLPRHTHTKTLILKVQCTPNT